MSRKHMSWTVALAAVTLLVVSVPSFAAGKPGTEIPANNLSVPAILIDGGFTGVTPGLFVMPAGVPATGYEIDPTAYYYVQGVHQWQAACITAPTASARAEWGDNLTGDANLMVSKPIRVELGLYGVEAATDPTVGGYVDQKMDGFTVVKLEPSKLDRESAYGTLATADDQGVYSATVSQLTPRVFDGGATFSVQKVDGPYVVPEGSDPTAEINAAGAIVYGYNLRVTAAGLYVITFVLPKVDVTGVDAGSYTTSVEAADTVSVTIKVVAGGGGGKRMVSHLRHRHHHRIAVHPTVRR